MSLTISCTGHRPDKVARFETTVRSELRTTLLDTKPDEAICGMALGVDTWFAETCIDLSIPFIAAVPFVGQDAKWPKADRVRFDSLCSKAKQVVVVCDGGYVPWKFQSRNVWMVDHSDLLLAVWNGDRFGGTFNCVEYARKIHKPIRRIVWTGEPI